MEIIYMNM